MKLFAVPYKLKEYREAKGLTQFAIAKLLNMEQTTYSKKELGKYPFSYESALLLSRILEKM